MNEGEERVLLTEPEADSTVPTPAPAQPQNEEQVEEDAKLETLSQKLERFAEEAEEDSESVYKPPTEDPYTKAVKYMEMHNVMQIFQVREAFSYNLSLFKHQNDLSSLRLCCF